MKNVVKLKENNSLDDLKINELKTTETSQFIPHLSADEQEKLNKIELLEQQVNALYLVSQKLQNKDKTSKQLFVHIKKRIEALNNQQSIDSQSFTEQYDELKNQLSNLSNEMQLSVNSVREEFRANQELHITQIKESTRQIESKQSDHSEQLSEHSDQLSELRSITQKLTSISDKLSNTVSHHDDQIIDLEKTSIAQQDNIAELFDQTNDLNAAKENIMIKQKLFSSDLNTMNQQQDILLKHNKQLDTQQKEMQVDIAVQNKVIDKRFKISNWATAFALVALSSLGTAFYMQNNDQVQQLQDQNIIQSATITEQAQLSSLQSAQMSQQISVLELQLQQLKTSFKNNEITQINFEQAQTKIADKLKQLATKVSVQNKEVNIKVDQQLQQQEYYKKIQFLRQNQLPVYDQAWINSQKKYDYSIQVVSSTSKPEMLRFIKANPMVGEVAIRESHLHGTTWYSVVNGKYDTKVLALNAANNLPESIQINKPWVRSFKQLRKIN